MPMSKLLLVISICAITCPLAFGQATPAYKFESDYSETIMNPSYLQGLTEAILVGGQPTLRISNRTGQIAEVKLQTRDGEDAVVFDVQKLITTMGKLFVTKTKLIFVPNSGNSAFFKIDRSQLKSVKLRSRFRLGGIPNVSIDSQDGEKNLVVAPLDMKDRETMMAANAFLARTINDFDGAVREFKQLTKSVQPESEELVEEADSDGAEVVHKYDRFKDITVVQTPRVLLQGSKRILRSHVELGYAGKTLDKLEKVSLILNATSSRPMFRDDNLELNFLIDGERVPLGNMKIVDESQSKTSVKQSISVILTLETLKRIANAKKAEFQIGEFEYKISDAQLALFRNALTYKLEN